MNQSSELAKLVSYYGITDKPEQKMRNAFIDTAEGILKNNYHLNETEEVFGLEVEVPLLDKDLGFVKQGVRDRFIDEMNGEANVELAAHQLEIVPKNLWTKTDGITQMFHTVCEFFSNRFTTLLAQNNVQTILLGAYPFPVTEIPFTSGLDKYRKYKIVPSWHHENLTSSSEHTPLFLNPYVLGLMNSIQVTVDAQSHEDAIDKLNRSLLISPIITAIAANAPILDLKFTGWADVRFVAWQISHDTRSPAEVQTGKTVRVGMPNNYYRDLTNYFARLLRHRFILNEESDAEFAFEIGNGLNWRDARLKFFPEQGKIGVEFRPIAIQPTIEENAAMIAFYLARLGWSQDTLEPFVPIEYVIWNKQAAMKSGLASELYVYLDGSLRLIPAQQIFKDDLAKVKTTLRKWGYSLDDIQTLLRPLEKRLTFGCPAQQLITGLSGNSNDILSPTMYNRNKLISELTEIQAFLPKGER